MTSRFRMQPDHIMGYTLWVIMFMLFMLQGCAVFEPAPDPCTATDAVCKVEALERKMEQHRQCVWLHGADSVICR